MDFFQGIYYLFKTGNPFIFGSIIFFPTSQVEELASIIDSREELGSIILRNAALDDNMLEILTPSLKNRLDLKVRSSIYHSQP